MKRLAVLILMALCTTLVHAQKAQRYFEKGQSELANRNIDKAKEYFNLALEAVPAERTDENDRLTEDILMQLIEIAPYEIVRKQGPEILRKLEEEYGVNDTMTTDYLGFFGQIAFSLGEYGEAEKYFEKSIRLFERAGYTNSINYGMISSNLGLMRVMNGKFKEAIAPLEKSYKVFNKNPEMFKVELAIVHSNLGQAYQSAYNELSAFKNYTRSLQLFKEANVREVDYYNTLNNLLTLYVDYNQYENAAPLNKDLIKYNRRTYGESSEEYAITCNNAAVLFNALGDYVRAEEYYQKAADIKLRQYSKRHPSYILALHNQGKFFSDMGRHAQGLKMVDEAIELCNNNNNISTQILEYLNTRASILLEEGEAEEALITHRDLIAMAKDVYGLNSEPYNMYMINYAVVLDQAGHEEQSERISDSLAAILDQLELFESDYHNFLHNRSVLLFERGQYEPAIAMIRRLMSDLEKKYSVYHPTYIAAQFHYATCLHAAGKGAEAYRQELTASEKLLDNAEQIFGTLTEIEKAQLIEDQQNLIKTVYRHFYGAEVVSEAFLSRITNVSLRLKSIVLNHSMVSMRKIERSNRKLKGRLQELKDKRSLYAKAIYLSSEERQERGLDLEKLLARIRLDEKELLAASGVSLSSAHFNWRDVQSKLKDNEAAVQVLHSPADRLIKSTTTYEAIVIKKDLDKPLLVNLGEDDLLDSKYYVSFLKAIGYKVKEGKSYERYWKAIDAHLEGISRVYFTGEGIYHKLSVDALYDIEANEYLGDRIDLVNVSNLVTSNFDKSYLKKRNDAVFFGNPDFYAGAVKEGASYSLDHHVTRSKVKLREVWGDLPGAEEEVKIISEMFQRHGFSSEVYLNSAATEERVKGLSDPSILHFATHGFYEYNEDTVSSRSSIESFVYPMLNSAVLLNGGGVSYGLREGHSLSLGEDGILSAYEAQNLDLDKTKLVVMSACESGLGSIRDAEGVFGLQRGFLLAGVDHVMMSLWKVNDAATKDFMVSFYKAYLSGAEIHDAFRTARVETRKKYPEPTYWAAFVLITN